MPPPPAKKQKTGHDSDNSRGPLKNKNDGLLPVTVWASILEYLELSDVMKALLLCRDVAFQATKEVTTLVISRSNELDARLSRRFPNIKRISLRSLMSSSETDETRILNVDMAERVVHFLTSFNQLEVCNVIDSSFYDYQNCQGPVGHEVSYKEMIVSFCNAFKANALRPGLYLEGFIGGCLPPHYLSHCCEMNATGSDDASCKLCRRICSNLPLYNVITLPCRWTDGAQTAYAHSLCISTGSMADILRSRKWTDVCIYLGSEAYDYLFKLMDITPSSLGDDFDVEMEKCNAFVADLKRRGIEGDIYLIPSEQLDRAECLLDLVLSHQGKEREGNLWSRKTLMEVMHKDKPTGGYALVKRTFDRLVKIGFDLDVKDFILLDEEEEEALEPFRKGSGG